ncbi:sensor domain-containing diguanylate cyclase [Methylotenera mobilis]|uniref:diguanylate cyclase n=1 Tax=Methylotenera mobilis (strain JLW8 / ATCC BAA-1282 / DSM 17540) TaxID=583345 RepID=C6WYY6_METML|nr:sensor domain-containing diguanylate cyclase [Methylotenera mobilis]ACT47111.1 diguanylate cyclase with PAS/PAC sensor [Methylotenera mobilis JLW8]
MTNSNDNFEADSAVYKTLLESTKAIPWKIDWNTLQFSYIGPQIEQLLGWTPASWVTVEDWASRMHPEDRAWVVDYCVAQSKSGTDHEADYRALTKDGEYVWIRDVVHVVRNAEGMVEALIGFMFDITERKNTEQKLIVLQKELEELSFKDALTGVYNRRMFDSVMEVEWANAKRNHQPLSLLMLDIDYFKQYNDHYGHIHGDECLKLVAKALSNVGTRSRDFFARFGGEEFIVVLPETDAAAANMIAERCRSLIFKAQIPHEKSLVSQILTVSIGVSTIIPAHSDQAIDLIAKVDRQLYQAKEKGRNRIA